jgi:hypothetical protein
MFCTFPEGARWSAEQQAVEFVVVIDEYQGVARRGFSGFPIAGMPRIGEHSRRRSQRNYSERRLLDAGRGSALTGI